MIAMAIKIAKFFSSLWVTLVLLLSIVVVLAVERLFDVTVGSSIGASLTLPFAGLCVNLLAAVVTRSKIRNQGGLLVFHLALAAIALMAAGGRFFALNGHVEMTQGTAFDPTAVKAKVGFLHPWSLEEVQFIQGPFQINYEMGMNRRDTLSTVFLRENNGQWRPHAVGDDIPLVLNGYRFYTTFNKGFAPILTYRGRDGQDRTGSIHLPSYPLHDYNQGNEWSPPDGSPAVQLWLRIAEPVYFESGAWKFDLPKNPILVIETEETRTELKPGQSIALSEGTLSFDEVRTWMGYKVFYDPIMAWMLAASILAACGLAWHVIRKLRMEPWDRSHGTEAPHVG